MLADEINDAYLRGYKDGKDYEANLLAHIAKLERVVRRVASLNLGPMGFYSCPLFELREQAVSALASERQGGEK